ncbi:MAG: hypothetical protein JSR99_13045 [Proteobacteria bacterium]|nr:hypothetical protein [Pseudomonadota bacterium]
MDAMPKRKEPELDPKEQFKRFQETAKEHGVDKRETEIESAFTSIAERSAKQKLKKGS